MIAGERTAAAAKHRSSEPGGIGLTSKSQIPALKVMMGCMDMMDDRER